MQTTTNQTYLHRLSKLLLSALKHQNCRTLMLFLCYNTCKGSSRKIRSNYLSSRAMQSHPTFTGDLQLHSIITYSTYLYQLYISELLLSIKLIINAIKNRQKPIS